MKLFLRSRQQGMRFAILVLKVFLPYFLYVAARKIYSRSAPAGENESEEEKRFLFCEQLVPPLYQNRRIVTAVGTSSYLFYLQCLRDSFPEDDRFYFGFAEFQASGKHSPRLFSKFLAKKKIFVTMETPIIGRHYFNDLATQAKGYFRVGLHNSVTLNRSDFALPRKASTARLKRILHNTHSDIVPYRKTGKHILYPLQMPSDTNLLGTNPFEAAQYDLITLRRHTSRPIVVTVKPHMVREQWAIQRIDTLDESKVHYRCLKDLCRRLGVTFYDGFEKKGTNSSMFLKNCWCVVCHSVTFAVDAVMAGVPVIALHPASFVYPICSHALSEIENPKMPDRIPWLSRLAYCQWTLDEIRNGDVWRHFQPSIKSLLEKR